MAWNGSSSKDGQKSSAQNATKKTPSPIRGVIAGIVVVALAVGAYLAFSPGSEEKPQKVRQEKKPAIIKEVKPAKAATNAVVAVPTTPKKVVEIRKLDNGMLQKYVDGKPRWAYPRKPPTSIVITNTTAAGPKTYESTIFKNHAEEMIAVLLNTELGEPMVGDSEVYFGRAFMKSLEASLSKPVEINMDDSAEVRELKKAVEDTKDELRKRLAEGEDIRSLLVETRKEIQELGLYRQELEKQVHSILKDRSLTPKDVKDLVSAANKMLEDRGAKPLSLPSFLERRAAIWSKKYSGETSQ